MYHRVFSVLRQRMVDGTYRTRERLAPEDVLAQEFGVSRATIRQAVGELVRLGFVSREQGRGTFVLPITQRSIGPVFRGSLEDLVAETHRAQIGDIEIEHDAPIPERIAERLQLSDGVGTIVRRTRTMAGEPFGYTVNYLPSTHGRPLTPRRLRSTTLMELLEKSGITIAGATQTIRAGLADVDVAASLQTEVGEPVLSVERLISDEREAPIELVRSWFRADLYEYRVIFQRGDDTAGARVAPRDGG